MLVDGSKLTLPSYKLPHQGIGYQKSPHILLITNASTIEYSNPELKALTCDVIVDVKNTKLGIIFFMKAIPVLNLTDLDERLGGVIGINIKEVALKDNKAVNNLRNHMKFMLEGKTFAKKWIYHKNEKAKIASHEQRLQKQAEVKIPVPWMSKSRKTAYTVPDIKKDALTVSQQWYCIKCDHDYQGTEKGINKCPLCHEHLYRVEI